MKAYPSRIFKIVLDNASKVNDVTITMMNRDSIIFLSLKENEHLNESLFFM